MPGPITHTLTAQNFLKEHGSEIRSSNDFYLGALFPDIRYVSKLTREQTHLPADSLGAVLAPKSDFDKGVIFHNYIDTLHTVKREALTDYIAGVDVLEIVAHKICEDDYLLQYFIAPDINYSSMPKSHRLVSLIAKSDIERWFKIQSEVINNEILDKTPFLEYLGFEVEAINKISSLVESFSNRQSVIGVADYFRNLKY